MWIKKAAALTHKETGRLDAQARRRDRRRRRTRCSRGKHRDQFVVDPYQAGAGTSHNMNVNEVLANRANEILGGKRGDVHAGASERSREHGAVARTTRSRRTFGSRALSRARRASTTRSRRCAMRSRRRDASSTTSSRRGARICRTRCRSGSARSSPRTRARSTAASSASREAADYLRDLGIGGSAVGTGVTVEKEYPALMNKHLQRDHRTRSARRRRSHSADAEHGRRRRHSARSCACSRSI